MANWQHLGILENGQDTDDGRLHLCVTYLVYFCKLTTKHLRRTRVHRRVKLGDEVERAMQFSEEHLAIRYCPCFPPRLCSHLSTLSSTHADVNFERSTPWSSGRATWITLLDQPNTTQLQGEGQNLGSNYWHCSASVSVVCKL